MTTRTHVWLAAMIAALPVAAQGQVLSDPTRPPAALAGSAAATEDAPVGTQLQSVLISSRRRIAVINGVTVPLGGMVGEARLVKISETEVVLKTGEELEVLKLYPGVDKQPVKRGAARQGGSK